MKQELSKKVHIEFKHQVPFAVKELKELKDDDGDLTLRGYASTFGNMDRGKDIMVKGCFKKSLKNNKGKWPLLLNHKAENTVGMNVKAKEDANGLLIESKIYYNENAVPESEKAVKLIKNAMRYEHPMGLSIGGIIKDMKFIMGGKGEESYFEIKEFDIIEHSITSTPMNPKAEITALKSSFSKISELKSSFIKENTDNERILFDFIKKYVNSI